MIGAGGAQEALPLLSHGASGCGHGEPMRPPRREDQYHCLTGKSLARAEKNGGS